MTTARRFIHARSGLLSLSAVLIFAALLSVGCTSSDQPGTSGDRGKLDVYSQLSGRVPGDGTLTLGATNADGQTVARTTIRAPALSRATLTVPPGHYRVAVWLPHSRLTQTLSLCSVSATAQAGTSVKVALACLWH
jgi:hypothetical protein